MLTAWQGALCDVILESDVQADLTSIERWADKIHAGDSVVTFNYDTLVERALSEAKKTWHHGFADGHGEVTVCKLHGSIDWIVAHRAEHFSNLDLLFEKDNANWSDQNTGHILQLLEKADQSRLAFGTPPIARVTSFSGK